MSSNFLYRGDRVARLNGFSVGGTGPIKKGVVPFS